MTLRTPGFAYVYWIHTKEQKDFITSGYIGVSTNPTRRWYEHKRDAMGGYHVNNFLQNIILKYSNDLEIEVIFGGTIDQCYEYEKELRPSPSLGWNLMSGGRIGKATAEGYASISKAVKTRNRKPLTKLQQWKRYKLKYNSTISFTDFKEELNIKTLYGQDVFDSWKEYENALGISLNFKEYQNRLLIQNKVVPIDLQNIPIFDTIGNEQYINITEAASKTGISEIAILRRCYSVEEDRFIFMRNL